MDALYFLLKKIKMIFLNLIYFYYLNSNLNLHNLQIINHVQISLLLLFHLKNHNFHENLNFWNHFLSLYIKFVIINHFYQAKLLFFYNLTNLIKYFLISLNINSLLFFQCNFNLFIVDKFSHFFLKFMIN